MGSTVLTTGGIEDDERAGDLQMIVISNRAFATHPLPAGSVLTIGRSRSCNIHGSLQIRAAGRGSTDW